MDPAEFGIEQTVGLLRDAAQAMRSAVTSPADEVRALATARNAIDARMSELLAEMGRTKAHEADGAASITTWATRELNQDPKATRQMVEAARTMRDLPTFGRAARTGQLSSEHVNAMSYALKHVGHDETVEVETELLQVATCHTPHELFTLARRLKAIVHDDDLDEAWLRGMDKQDLQCLPVGDGFHVRGFLPIDVGARLRVFLDSVSVPRDGDDTRTNPERRIDGLDELLTRALGEGLPAAGGVKPHVSVVVDVENLKNAVNHTPADQGELDLKSEPAILEGFGPIGPALLAYIAFGGELTPILVAGFKENRRVLDVGRTKRVATKRQRAAIRLRQKGRCANRGCHHPIGEIHHIVDWLYGGKTDLANLAGLCRKCHALITVGRLKMTGTWDAGYTFSTSRASPLARAG